MSERRVLYLSPSGTMEVRREGPALAVRSSGTAPRWYPVSRLARVVSHPKVAWHGEAMRLLMREGIPLLFVDGDGAVTGLCIGGIGPAPDDLRIHLETAMAAPSWPEAYGDWLRAEERRMLFHIARALGWSSEALQPEPMRRRLAAALEQTLGAASSRTMRALLAYARGLVAEELALAGLGPEVSTGLCGGVALAHDLAVLLGWSVRGRVVAMPPREKMQNTRALAAYYTLVLEPRLRPTLRRLIARLWRLRLG